MTVTGVGTVAGGLDLRGNAEDLSGLLGAINKVGGAAAGQAGKRIEFESELDLTDPANRAAARAFIDGVNPATGDAVDLAQASTRPLRPLRRRRARPTCASTTWTRWSAGVDIDGSVLGFSAKYSRATRT